ncbi:glutamate racemase [Granulicella arctica]|uniref:glutamate racemase n=1 Tax=Granulicella arctica TaxID=940613 RepID=UPI0021DFA9AE|nr:glutamate racemase [Granulicella arctica]
MSLSENLTIGVFDSGFGGLTVLRALLPLIPGAHYIYLGDTARLPYGSKSQATIARYAVESAQFLVARGADMLVIACNTATALALPEIIASVPVPLVGVIEPVVQMAHYGRQNTQVLVLATQATVHSHAYLHACERRDLLATEKACPLLVPLVEEGWIDHPVTRDVLRIYLSEALQLCSPSAVLLGCTHYPLLVSPIEQTLLELNSNAVLIDSARATAEAAAAMAASLQKPSSTHQPVTFEFYATDSIEKFQNLGSRFLGQPLNEVKLLDLGG